jgi:hypothetical protein
MNLEKIDKVKYLARLFEIRAAEVHLSDLTIGTAASGALRRTSMELTRALADLRREAP